MKVTATSLACCLLLCCYASTCAAQSTWTVGHSSRTVLPPVDGRTDYWTPLPPTDSDSAGTFVKKFDFGQIAVGNGASECHWVRDDIRVRAAAIGPDTNGITAVFVSAEVYMLLLQDLQQYYDAVRERVGAAMYANLRFFVHAQHNHEGPDTSGLSARPINHKFYDYLVQQMTDATIEALDPAFQQQATLKFGSDVFYYGLGDKRDPLLQDARVRVLRAYGTNNTSPFLTMIQWGMHPEVTLGFSPKFDIGDCRKLPIPRLECSAKGAVFTHDFPGHFSEEMIKLQGGGEAMYFNGAIGVQIGNHGPVWEVDSAHPLGNGGTVPNGAVIAPKSYRRAFLIGEQLAKFVSSIKDNATPVPRGAFDYRRKDVWTRVTNLLFRAGMIPTNAVLPWGDPTRPIRIGNTMRMGYTCEDGKAPSNTTCKPDNYGWRIDSVSKVPIRNGNFMKSEIEYIKIGPITFVTIPGEICPELVAGLPRDFDEPSSVSKYFKDPTRHAVGKAYAVPGVAMDMLNCDENSPCFFLGLTQDEVGYAFPMSDWRVRCVVDAEECEVLFNRGVMNFTDSMAGAQCKRVVEQPTAYHQRYVQEFDENAWDAVNRTCYYGQAFGQAKGHYEETNASSWDVAENYLKALAELLNTPLIGRFCATNHTCQGMVPSPSLHNSNN